MGISRRRTFRGRRRRRSRNLRCTVGWPSAR
jgi:hypothetical protein